jgi:hypothetical protein
VTLFWDILKGSSHEPNTFPKNRPANLSCFTKENGKSSSKILIFTLNVTPLFQFCRASFSGKPEPFDLKLAPFFSLADFFIR